MVPRCGGASGPPHLNWRVLENRRVGTAHRFCGRWAVPTLRTTRQIKCGGPLVVCQTATEERVLSLCQSRLNDLHQCPEGPQDGGKIGRGGTGTDTVPGMVTSL